MLLGRYKEFCEHTEGLPSIKESFNELPYENMDKIIWFLKNKGESYYATAGIPHDVITGERINISEEGMKYNDIYWVSTLAYYVEKYNLRFSKEIEDIILKSVQ